MSAQRSLFDRVTLPCGVRLKNRIAKSAMSDSLGDGTGHPTRPQNRLYQRWAEGGLAVSIIGEVQCSPRYAEKPGNLVLNDGSDLEHFRELARIGGANDTQLWMQLGHAGALAYPPTSAPKGPSALELPGLTCAEMTLQDIQQLPRDFARTAQLAQKAGFGGVQIHSGHGFLLSQFLSPLFNKRTDRYGGGIANRVRPLLEAIAATRASVGPGFPVGVKMNSSDMLEGGLTEDDALEVVAALNTTSVDLIDISGGTYFPGAKAASDGAGGGPYFLNFARRARALTDKPLMLTGGVKTRSDAEDAIKCGAVDVVGIARAFALEPGLPNPWKSDQCPTPEFPRFSETPEGGITAWYTMRLTEIGEDREESDIGPLRDAIRDYEGRDVAKAKIWNEYFS